MSAEEPDPIENIGARPDVDLRPWLARTVPSQGPRPLCLPFALSAAHESLLNFEDAREVSLAVESIWRYCVLGGNASEGGTLLEHAADGIQDDGQVEIAFWPYNDFLAHDTEEPPPGCPEQPWRTASWRRVHIHRDGVEPGIEDCLAAGFPVVDITVGGSQCSVVR